MYGKKGKSSLISCSPEPAGQTPANDDQRLLLRARLSFPCLGFVFQPPLILDLSSTLPLIPIVLRLLLLGSAG